MKTFPHLAVCHHCDSVYLRRPLGAGEAARCERCRAIVYRAGPVDFDRRLALVVTAAVAFAIANTSPILYVSLRGLHNEATLWQTVAALAHGATLPLALGMALALIVAPCLQIVLFAWVLAFARTERSAPGFVPIMKILAWLRPWSMVEVGLLGMLAAGVKLSGFLDVAPAPGGWALAALMLLVFAIGRQDIHALWQKPGPQGHTP